MPSAFHAVRQVEKDEAEQKKSLLDRNDFLALERIIAIRLLLELVDLVPE